MALHRTSSSAAGDSSRDLSNAVPDSSLASLRAQRQDQSHSWTISRRCLGAMIVALVLFGTALALVMTDSKAPGEQLVSVTASYLNRHRMQALADKIRDDQAGASHARTRPTAAAAPAAASRSALTSLPSPAHTGSKIGGMLANAEAVCRTYPEVDMSTQDLTLSPLLLFDTRSDGMNNQLDQVFDAIVLSQTRNVTLVLMDMWPEWWWGHEMFELHRPFERFYSPCGMQAAGVSVVSMEVFRSLCNNNVDLLWDLRHPFLRYPAHRSKLKILNITASRITKRGVSTKQLYETGLTGLVGPKDRCVGISLLPSSPPFAGKCRERPLPYRTSFRKNDGRMQARRALQWSPFILRMAASASDMLELPRDGSYIALHVRRGDYLKQHCKKYAAEKTCPTVEDVAQCIRVSGCTSAFIATNDKSGEFVGKVRAQLGAATPVKTTWDLSNAEKNMLAAQRGDLGVIDQVLSHAARAFVGVAVSSFSSVIMGGRDADGVPHARTISYVSPCKDICNGE